MNVRKFLRDWRTGRNDYTTAEAAEYLDIELESFRHLIRAGVIKPFEGGVRGRNLYFSPKDVEALNDKIDGYR